MFCFCSCRGRFSVTWPDRRRKPLSLAFRRHSQRWPSDWPTGGFSSFSLPRLHISSALLRNGRHLGSPWRGTVCRLASGTPSSRLSGPGYQRGNLTGKELNLPGGGGGGWSGEAGMECAGRSSPRFLALKGGDFRTWLWLSPLRGRPCGAPCVKNLDGLYVEFSCPSLVGTGLYVEEMIISLILRCQ